MRPPADLKSKIRRVIERVEPKPPPLHPFNEYFMGEDAPPPIVDGVRTEHLSREQIDRRAGRPLTEAQREGVRVLAELADRERRSR